MLHVLNGDATADALRVADIPGDRLVWGDALLGGPAPHALRSRADWEMRAAHLARDWGLSIGAYLQGVDGFFRRLDQGDPDEVVLWFEEDLFCQLPLCMLLARPRKEGGAKCSVVCPEWPLGARGPAELRALFEQRAPAEARQELASRAWAAYGADDPTALTDLLGEADFSAWPLLRRGVLAHLARFPSVENGLNAVEAALLRALAAHDGPMPFTELFRRWNEGPLQPTYGLGDHQVALALHALAACGDPLVRVEGAQLSPDVGEQVMSGALAPTPTGRAVLADDKDHARLNPPDRWLGGVRLAPGRPLWRWDAAGERLVLEP